MVTEYLTEDHHRLEALQNDAFAARTSGDFAAARQIWADFVDGLDRHIRIEEDVLFPLFEERSGMGAETGPTAVMREEHGEIRSLLASITQVIGDANGDAERLRRSLAYVLEEHHHKEEEVLYPATDSWLSPRESEDLAVRFQALSAGGR